MKKIGSILFCFVPFLIAIAMQFIVMFIGTMLYSFKYMLSDPDALLNSPAELTTNLLNDMLSSSSFSVGISAIYAILTTILFSFWYYRKFARHERLTATSTFHPLMLAAVVLLSISLQYLSSYIVSILAFLRPDWLQQYERIIQSLGLAQSASLLTIIYTCLIAPISEELLFRGMTLRYAKNTMPLWAANLFQAALFGLLHMNYIQGIYAFLLGIVFGHIALKSKSLLIPILFHMIFNSLGVFLPEALRFGNAGTVGVMVILVLCLGLLILGLLLFHKGTLKRDARNEEVHSEGAPLE